MNNQFGESEKEVKILDLTEEDIARIETIVTEMGGKKVSVFNRRIRSLDNGISTEKDQLLRVTDEDGHVKLSLHINQSNEQDKKHIKCHFLHSDRLIELLEARYNEKVLTDIVARRISYEIGEGEDCVDLDIDSFPAIPSFMEIDLANLSKQGLTLEELLIRLNLQNHRIVQLGTEAIHSLYGINYFEAYAPKSEEEKYNRTL